MEIDHVYELVHHLSERCEFDRTAQLKGLGKVAKAVEKLEWVGEGLDRIEGRLNGSWAAEPSTNEGDEEDAWLVLWIAGTRFNNFVGLGIVISTVVSILTLACLLIYAGRMCRRQKLKGLAQVHTRTEWEQMKGMAQVSLPNCANLSDGIRVSNLSFAGQLHPRGSPERDSHRRPWTLHWRRRWRLPTARLGGDAGDDDW